MNNITVTEFKDIRVLTTQQLAEQYETDSKTISNNFNRNKDRYQEGKHYILLQGEEKRNFINYHQIDDGSKKASVLYLWTEKGCLFHAKSLGTDKAWEAYEKLVDFYFSKKEHPKSPIQLLELELAAIKEIDTKVESVNDDLQQFKQDMPLLGLECDRITTAIKTKGVNCLGGKDSSAYHDKSLRGRVYQDMHHQIKREFGVSTYKAIKRSQTDLAVKKINEYQLPVVLADEVQDTNNQVNISDIA